MSYTDDYTRSGYAGHIPPVNEDIPKNTPVNVVLGQFDRDGKFHQVVTGKDYGGILTADPSLVEEVRVTDPETGGSKGSKLARFDMIPPDVLWELAEHYGKGEAKYPSDPETGQPNWQRGYSWRLSVAALMRHLTSWLTGEDVDPETGSNHLIAVIWHAMALRYFQIHGKGKDYR